MTRLAALLPLVLTAVVAARAAGAPDPVQECRDTWADARARLSDAADARQANDAERSRRAEQAYRDALARFRAVFARTDWEALDVVRDGALLDDGYAFVVRDARARGDLAAARRACEAHVRRLRTEKAFEARGVTMPELDLAAGDVDAALRGFRAGARQSSGTPAWRDRARGAAARLRIGDVLAACGDLAGARAEFDAARSAYSFLGVVEGPTVADAKMRGLQDTDVRGVVGSPLPALPRITWVGDAPADAPQRVLVLCVDGVGRRGDAGRLRGLDGLSAEMSSLGVDVRVVVSGDLVGAPDHGRKGATVVRVPRGPDDAEGEEVAYDGRSVAGLVARVRDRLGLRIPLGVVAKASEIPAYAPTAIGRCGAVFVADRGGRIVHASVVGETTDWVCGIARVVASGRGPKPQAARSAPADAEARAACARNLVALAQAVPQFVQRLHMLGDDRSPRSSGPAFWLRCVDDVEDASSRASLLLCPADAEAWAPETTADGYLWDSVDLAGPPAWMCSYAGRDLAANPLARDDVKAVVGACLHHPGGAFVVRADGTVEPLSLSRLGIASDAEKTVGPQSKSPLLRVLR